MGMRSVYRSVAIALISATGLTVGAGCGGDDPVVPVRSYLDGQVTVRAEVDSIPDYRDFEILVAAADGSGDTLGYAVTDSTGAFRMSILAAERGVYPLVVSRRGAVVADGQIVVADGDSATMRLRVPVASRMIVIRSPENAAWLAYRNTKALHNRDFLELLQSGRITSDTHAGMFRRTADMYWNLRTQFAGTIGADVAAAESILLMEGIDDSLVVRRAQIIAGDRAGFEDVARAARRAQARLGGLESAIALLDSFKTALPKGSDLEAALESEVVMALVDSGEVDRAVGRARALSRTYPKSAWADWAKDAVYEMENLMPGMPAPTFQARTWDGDEFSFTAIDNETTPLLLEFFGPTDESFRRELAARDTLIAVLARMRVATVAISVETDSTLNEAFFESRDQSHFQLALPAGHDDPIARLYNVRVLPKRVLILNGNIVGKYVGPGSIRTIINDAEAVVSEPPA